MALLNTIKHMRIRFKTISGYIKYLLTSDSVIMKNGKDLQTEIDTIHNKLVELDTHLAAKFDTENTNGRFHSLRCESSPKGAGGQTYGRTFCFDLGVGKADKYYLAIASNGGLYVGLQLNGASTITWIQK